LNEPAEIPALIPINGFAIYENQQFGIRIQYPETWDKKDGENSVAFVVPL
jgi:hypothetical protein